MLVFGLIMGSIADVVSHSSREARQAQVEGASPVGCPDRPPRPLRPPFLPGLASDHDSGPCRRRWDSFLRALRRRAAPPPVPQLYRQKIEAVNDWMRDSHMQRPLKARVRDFYAQARWAGAGGGGRRGWQVARHTRPPAGAPLTQAPAPPPPPLSQVWVCHASSMGDARQLFGELPHQLRQEIAWELNRPVMERLPLFGCGACLFFLSFFLSLFLSRAGKVSAWRQTPGDWPPRVEVSQWRACQDCTGVGAAGAPTRPTLAAPQAAPTPVAAAAGVWTRARDLCWPRCSPLSR